MLEIAVAKSKIPPTLTDITCLPSQCIFVVFLTILKDTLRVTRLVKKLKHWFKEGRKKSFSYRFTGKETKQFCQKFAFLLQSLCDKNDPPELKQKISALNFCCVQLRDATAYYSRVYINADEIEKCKQACQYFVNIYALMLRPVTPTVWTIGYAVPAHLKILFNRYGMGLDINSMHNNHNLLSTQQKVLGGPWFCGMILSLMFGFESKTPLTVAILSTSTATYQSK